MNQWPFEYPENTSVFTSKKILDKSDWIYYVTHDEEDGAWQFHPYSGITPEHEAAVVSLKSIVDIDNSVCQLADLPLGWHAWRDIKDGKWTRSPKNK